MVIQVIVTLLPASMANASQPPVLRAESFQHHIDRFNAEDDELYANAIPNTKAWDFLKTNIPLFECPDEDIERTYYFRFWTYRKHLKETPDGWVVTEFLPSVSWSMRYNTICCPAGHHFYEGRWLHNPEFLEDYAMFWFRKGGSPRYYSFWAADAIYAHYLVHRDKELVVEPLDDLVSNYKAWEKSRLMTDGLFWQIDDRDGMEVSIGKSGKRATINSYMYGDARAIAKIARLADRTELADRFDTKADRLRALVQDVLWDDETQFFKTLPRSPYELVEPKHSADDSVLRHHWHDKEHLGTLEWLQYDFDKPIKVDSIEVYWYDNGGPIQAPQSWRILARDGDTLKPVVAAGAYGIVLNRYNRTTFETVETDALRLEVQSQKGKAAGLYEWRVFSGETNIAPEGEPSCSFLRTNRRLGNTLRTLNDGEGKSKNVSLVDVRELHGYTPWYFNLPQPGKGYEVAWKQLMDPRGFYAPFGPTTAEQRHPGFKISYEGHGCQWNGPSWPMSTAVTLTGLANVLNNYPQDVITKADYLETLRIYARSHRRKLPNGQVISWIDENINPFTGEWIARTRCEERNAELKKRNQEDRILLERGKDYNHSSFCDLIITGLVGLRPRADGIVEVNPLVPEGKWDWFCLDNIAYHGHFLTILWDKTGGHYGKGKGLIVLADGKPVAQSDTLGRVTGKLPTPKQADVLYKAFQNPPAEAKPFVRWWWNGNCVTEEELLHELDVMRKAGIGGVEINPVGLPGSAERTDDKPLDWLSPEWNHVLKLAIDGAEQRGMVVDMIVGSGWPFGGRFLDNDETIQGVTLNIKHIEGPGKFTFERKNMMKLPGRKSDRTRSRLMFLRLIPKDAENSSDCIDLLDQVQPDGTVEVNVGSGRYTLCAGVLRDCFREVVLGAPGADGPVLDHFKQRPVQKYLDRMSDTLSPVLGGRMGNQIRAMFCDSIELSGANWTDDLAEQFEKRRGYSPTPYLPFLFTKNNFDVSDSFRQTVGRARYDFCKTLVEVFHERFVFTFHNWCRANGMQSRYQAYGGPWLYGMLDGYLIPDIPEGDTWIYFDRQNIGKPLNRTRYAVWNKYAASAAHLTGKRMVGCEAMTNLAGVFRASLEDVKQATDLNFITGVTHSILHGYSYSSPKAAFPGWVRYGTFFNEKNTWWPYFPLWAKYHARIAAVLQATTAQTEVAILGPSADVWAVHGLDRVPFIANPWYLHELWQAIHQSGCSADYISDQIVQDAQFTDGKLRFGPTAYKVLIVTESESMEPETAEALADFAEAGGRIIFTGRTPSRAPSLDDAPRQDRRVQAAMHRTLAADQRRVAVIPPPPESVGGEPDIDRDNLLAWTTNVLRRFNVEPAVVFDRPDRRLFQIHLRDGEREVFFLVNQDDERTLSFVGRFNTGNKTPWLWDTQTGTRHVFPHGTRKNELAIHLAPFDSMLLVFEPNMPGQSIPALPDSPREFVVLKGPWQVKLEPIIDEQSLRTIDRLIDFGTSNEPTLNTFAGTAIYKTQFKAPKGAAVLDLGEVADISEVTLNGKPLGVKWFGRHVYQIDKAVIPNKNVLEVKVTSVLYNYCHSLKGNRTASGWTNRNSRKPAPVGLLGPVRIGI